jgi:hypothetical protein
MTERAEWSMSTDPLHKIIEEQKQGKARGIYAVCSANRYVIEACMQQATHAGGINFEPGKPNWWLYGHDA